MAAEKINGIEKKIDHVFMLSTAFAVPCQNFTVKYGIGWDTALQFHGRGDP